MGNKKFLLAILLLLVIGFGFYGYLGGFNPVQVIRTTSKPVYVAGKYFHGNMQDKALGTYFQEAAKLLEDKKVPGYLGNIYYNNPEETNDSIQAFIGIVVPDSTVQLPAGYELRQWPGSRPVVQASVKAHFFLAPNKLYAGLFDYAKKNKLNIKKQYLEEFPKDRYGRVQAQLAN
ncbi:GyrI-like domain-containing protein [Adhaeribacter swui]|uniref:GyrI-like domain-containing protein n=1 Tax=Adhaeribacter swui TaxID=2086471 RepID=A0A7G7G8K7_9BACT|nr:GyrI-like domain-containing protein [Adhaeribacter swui]QNF33491.1 GyrI-like domain-containing protein [Adhaeribacter swui]